MNPMDRGAPTTLPRGQGGDPRTHSGVAGGVEALQSSLHSQPWCPAGPGRVCEAAHHLSVECAREPRARPAACRLQTGKWTGRGPGRPAAVGTLSCGSRGDEHNLVQLDGNRPGGWHRTHRGFSALASALNTPPPLSRNHTPWTSGTPGANVRSEPSVVVAGKGSVCHPSP